MSISNGIANLQALSTQVTPSTATAPTVKDQQVKTTATAAHPAVKINHPVDQAVISSTSGLLTEALGASDVRLEKVLPLQEAISAGNL